MRLLIGPSNAGKTQRIIERLVEARVRRLGGLQLVAPYGQAVQLARRQMNSAFQAAGLADPHPNSVTTFQGLCRRILARTGSVVRAVTTRERQRVLRRTVSELAREDALSYFAETAGQPGLVDSLSAFIDELWRSGVGPGEFRAIAASKKDLDLAAIFERFAATLGTAGMMDRRAAGLAALTALKERRLLRPFGLVAFDGFDSYPAVAVRLLAALDTAGVEVIASLAYEESQAVHLWHEPTIRRFRTAGAAIEKLDVEPQTTAARAALGLMSEQSSPVRSDPEVDPPIAIISAPDRMTEVRTVAGEIKRLVFDEGVQLDQIAIICRSLPSYSDHLKRVFRECGIRVQVEIREALAEHPLITGLMNLLNVASGGFRRRAVIECLRSPYFNFSPYGLDQKSIDLLDRLSIHHKVIRGRVQWESVLADLQAKNRKRLPVEPDAASVYQSLADGLLKMMNALTPTITATRPEYRDWVLSLASSVGLTRRGSEAEPRIPAEDNTVLQLFLDVVAASADDATVDEQIEFELFLSELDRAVALERMATTAADPPYVRAQELSSMSPQRYAAVFVIGLVEGELPARHSESSPYSSLERDRLRRSGIDLAETARDAGADLYLFYRAISRAGERLYLSYPRTDLTGGELIHSYLLDEIKTVAHTGDLRITQDAYMSGRLGFEGALSLEELALLTSRGIRDGVDDELIGVATTVLSRRLPSWNATMRAMRVERRRLAGLEQGSHGGGISRRDLLRQIRDRFGPEHVWSATQVNDYGICPFRFFARHVLELQSSVEPVEGMLAKDVGAAYHRVLERIHSRLKAGGIRIALDPEAGGGLLDSARLSSIVETECGEVLEEMARAAEIRRDALLEFEKSEFTRRVMRLLAAEAGWNEQAPSQPFEFERRFGIGATPPAVVTSEGGNVFLRGVIDRLDKRGNDLVVIDYKTGAAAISQNEALSGRNLQLPIYLMATSQVVKPGASVAGGFYLHINSCKKGSEFGGGESHLSVQAVIARAQNFIREYVAGIRDGKFPIRPNGPCPQYCEYILMCRIQSLSVRDDS